MAHTNASLSTYEEALVSSLRGWKPLTALIEEEFPEKEISILGKSISETLFSYSRIEKSDSIVELLEDFISDVFDQYQISLEESIIKELSSILISTHNHLKA
ncbi:hypothetical protein NEFER03_0827 [Nematocida sp. LUAm3]|nr:hypothetical protein NEFER03_0827 [Nematocida sp. LUAm3]KAI5174845.1 hypothetical protein NEFER02_0945 [Nematocida sp. LUAm2]KAI5177557.1 hypothetical protein NEFER01_0807 [Nematocida sp. LUAm1]